MINEAVINWWRAQNIQTKDDLRNALENFSIVFATNSNSIEGNRLTYHETRDIFEGKDVSINEVSVREIFEAQNQKFAFESILENFEKKEPLSIRIISQFHRVLMSGCYDSTIWSRGERPGHFKKNDYTIGMQEVGAFPDEVENEIKDLLAEINSWDGDVLLAAAYFHARFENIHPFADGNGRTGRLLLNYYLLLQNYPPLIISTEDKNVYYLALEVYDRTEEISGLKLLLEEELNKTWQSKVNKSMKKRLNKLNSF